MSDYIIDLPFMSQSAGTRWHEDCRGYHEICDVCGKKKKCHCLVAGEYVTIMDICRDCLKAHGKKVVQEVVE